MERPRAQLGRALLIGVLLAGCGSDDDGGEGPDTTGDAGGGANSAGLGGTNGTAGASPNVIDVTSLVGDFGVSITPEMLNPMMPELVIAANTRFLGKLFDKPKVPLVPFVLEAEQGDCKLLVPEVPFCDPRCMGEVCTEDGCVVDAVAQSAAGTVRVTGLGDEALELEPIGSSPSYQPASLPYPPCAEGDAVRVEADAFAIETRCVAPLEVSATTITVLRGEATLLSWTPPGEDVGSRVEVTLDISHHGGQKGELTCDAPDTGEFEIPEPLITQLVALGTAGFPTIRLTRVSRAAAAEAENITLTVSSSVERLVDIGMPSCSVDDDCPSGLTCNPANLLCH
jgi:hypothetical protein